jgi:hypothetical protein
MNSELEQQVIEFYKRYPQPRSFADEVHLSAWNGVIINTENFFMLARPVDIHDPEERWRDPGYRCPIVAQNCWYIVMCCGDIERNPCEYAPYKLPLVAWSRRDRRIKTYDFDKAQQKCSIFLNKVTCF